MKKRKRLLVLFLTAVLTLAWMPLEASANSPEPTPYYTFYLSNLPEGTEYVDLLILLPETDERYEELTAANIPDSFSRDAQILTYCEDGYRSYTFHYRDALALIRVHGDGYVRYFTDSETDWSAAHLRLEHAGDIETRGQVKLAMLDARGDILKISQPLDITAVNKFSYRLGTFYYDAATGELMIDAVENNKLDPPVRYLVSSVFGIALTCLLECLTAFLFKLKGYRSLIICTNVVSQILMRAAYAALYLYSSWGYTLITLVLEGLVLLGEFLCYRWKMTTVSWKTRLCYAISANALSWLLGHLINQIVFFGAFLMI